VQGGDGDAVRYRSNGPVEAAKKGAIAVIIRSVTHALDHYPHTGSTRYEEGVAKIPAFATSTLDAEWLSRQLKMRMPVQLYLKSNCSQGPDVMSYNVIGEIRGTEHPEEIITAGGHLDSWDLGEGAHDDGAGCVQSIEVIRAIKALGWRPKRTIRAVMFMNEENGLKGALAYADSAEARGEKHLFAIESDAGGFGVQTLGLSATPAQYAQAKNWELLLKPYGIYEISEGGGGADIGPLRRFGTALSGVNPGSQRYFDHHHAANDVLEAVNKRELELGAFSMAAICWLVSQYGL
ncbi:MAG TPA: M20/M25/M40 family metallo-hydrolase, partial [Phnomibacter sp.]|nr:M20/M25/M40 family metallo-hydrolase [Phnomibacter sp.]